MEGKCYHLYHEKAQIDQNLYARTLKMVAQSKTMSENDLKNHINLTAPKIGMLNKYDI